MKLYISFDYTLQIILFLVVPLISLLFLSHSELFSNKREKQRNKLGLLKITHKFIDIT